MAEKRSVTLLGVGDGCDVFSRHNQNVHGRLRIEIREGVAEIILVNCFRRNTPVNYLAEDATHVKESTDVRQGLSWHGTGAREITCGQSVSTLIPVRIFSSVQESVYGQRQLAIERSNRRKWDIDEAMFT